MKKQRKDFPENKPMDNVITQENQFTYTYSAKENKEIQEIQKKYLPQVESKFDELKRLDAQVQNSGMVESLSVGIGGALIFGLGMCLAMQVIGTGIVMMILGILIGLVGMAGMLVAHPVYRKKQRKTKEKFAPRILELTEELYQE